MSTAKRAKKDAARSFDDYTVAELRAIVDQSSSCESRIAEKDAEIARLDPVDEAEQAERVKAAVCKQFLTQMTLEKDLSEKECERLRGDGREVVAVVPNVCQGVMQVLGFVKCDTSKGKQVRSFFAEEPSKSLPGGASLRLYYILHFKYVKASCELKASGFYRWVAKPKAKAKGKRKSEEGIEDSHQDRNTEAGDEEQDEGNEDEAGEVAGEEEPVASRAGPPAKSPRPLAPESDAPASGHAAAAESEDVD